MDVLQERWFMIDHSKVISWYVQILKELLSNGNQINLFLFTEPIIFVLMNIIIVSPYNTSTLQVPYSFDKILKVIFIIHISTTWFYVNLILHPLHFFIQKFSPMKFSYLPLERMLVLIYWMMNILQSHISLIQSQVHQPVINFQHRLNENSVSFLSMGKSLSQLKVRLMNSIVIKMHGGHSRSIIFNE